MNEVLYRKYRPTSFSEIKGQDQVISILKHSVIQNKVSHAYLFSGPRGCGKTTIARLMTKAINCTNFSTKGDICNECEYCLAINSGNNIDVIEMDAASNRGIEEIRSLKDTVNFMPSFLKKKVYIIDEAHMLTKEALNALLKTLEEPPAHVVFILATTESNKLPITILSRVTRFDFRLGSEEQIFDKLKFIASQEGYEVTDEALKLIYKHSGGSFRDSESLLGKVFLSAGTSKVINENVLREILGFIPEDDIRSLVDYLLEGNSGEVLTIIQSLFDKDFNAGAIIEQLLGFIEKRIIETVLNSEDNYQILKLAEYLIKLKSEIRDFNDKAVLLKIELVHISNSLNIKNLANKSTNSSLGEIEKISQKVTTTTTKVENPIVEVKVGGSKESTFVESLVNSLSSDFPRLKGIMVNSKVTQENSDIIITNPYKFSIAYLSKKEVRTAILSLVSKIWGSDFGVVFKIGPGPEMKDDNSNQQVGEKKVEEAEPKKDLPKDNSSIVENIL